MYTPLQNKKLYEQVVDQIRRQIISNELKGGDQLPNERALAAQFGVSRTVVREAIRSLAKEGLVEVRHGRGTFIIDGTSQALERSLDLLIRIEQFGGITNNDLVEFREILEPGIAALAAVRADESDIATLRDTVALADANINNLKAYLSADSDFHIALAQATHNPLISIILNPVVDILYKQRERIFFVEGGPQKGLYHHKRILEAIIDKDPGHAREAMNAHMYQVREHTTSSARDEV